MVHLRAALVLVPLILVGCGGGQPDDSPELGTVTGTVTMDGSPLSGAVVTFSPELGRSSTGVTDGSGKYTLIYIRDTPGAKVGSHTVSIATATEADAAPTETPPSESQAKPAKDPIPAKYNSETTLTADVKAGENEINFELQK